MNINIDRIKIKNDNQFEIAVDIQTPIGIRIDFARVAPGETRIFKPSQTNVELIKILINASNDEIFHEQLSSNQIDTLVLNLRELSTSPCYILNLDLVHSDRKIKGEATFSI